MYDTIIIGSGPGGYVAAIKGAQLGLSVAIVEKNDLGGICLNHGCIPTKTLLKSAKVYQEVLKASSYGVKIDKSSVSVDWPKMLKRKNLAVKRLTTGVKGLLQKNGVDIIQGAADAIDNNSVVVLGKTYKTKSIIIATGASPFIPPIHGIKEGIKNNTVVTYKEILNIKEVPKNLVVLGGGVIGVEFATLFNAVGSKVTIIEKDMILQTVDSEIRDTFRKLLKKQGIKVLENTELIKITDNKAVINSEEIDFDTLLFSIGTKPNLVGTEKLNLETYGGGIVTNDSLETNIKNVYAIGDVNGRTNLAHVSSAEGEIAIENIAGLNKKMNYNRVPSGIYGFPEIAYVGLTEDELPNDNFIISKFPLAANGRALAEGATDGFIKIIADKEYGELVGVHIIGASATELIAGIVSTMELEGTIYELAKTIHPHPTISEIIMEAAKGAIDKPIHM